MVLPYPLMMRSVAMLLSVGTLSANASSRIRMGCWEHTDGPVKGSVSMLREYSAVAVDGLVGKALKAESS